MKLKILALILCMNFTFPAMADVLEDVIGPFPALGSPEEISDLNQLLYFQKTRTEAQCDQARSEENANLESFFGKLLSKEEIKTVRSKTKWLLTKTGVKIYYQKQKYKRPRPYLTHPEIKPCVELESSNAYPSGHATLARVYARVLSVMYPERSVLFMKRGDEVALNRVIGGVHHPSDIAAGKKLADAIADDYELNSDFYYSLKTINN